MARTIVTCNNDFVNYDNIVSITILKTDAEVMLRKRTL